MAISESSSYAAIPTLHEINICLAMQGHLCVLNTALYPVDKIEWCIYVLPNKDLGLIKPHCLIDFHTQQINAAINPDGYIWAVSSLVTEHVQIHCLEQTYLETIIT